MALDTSIASQPGAAVPDGLLGFAQPDPGAASVLGVGPSADPASMAGQQSVLSALPAPAAAGPGGIMGALANGPGGLFAEIGSNIQARIAANQAVQVQRQLLYAAMQQHLATVQRMADGYAAAGDTKTRDLLLADPDGFIKANQAAYQAQHTPVLTPGGESIITPGEGTTITAPLLAMTKDNQAYTQTPTQTTATGALPTLQDKAADHIIVPAPPLGTPAAGLGLSSDIPPPVGGAPGGQSGDPGQGGTPAQIIGPNTHWAPNALTPAARAFAAQVIAHPLIAAMSPQDQANILTIGYSESHLNPVNPNGSSTGRFQFQPLTFQAYMPGGNINSDADQITAEAHMYTANKATLTKSLGRDPAGSDMYMGAMQGPTGATALLTAPAGTNAVTALRSIGLPSATALSHIAANLPGFNYHTPAGRQAANSAAMKMSAQQFTNIWANHFNANQAHIFGGSAPQAAQPGSATMSVSGLPVNPPPPPPAPGTVANGSSWPASLSTQQGDQILTADQVPNSQPGWTYKRALDGSLTPIPPIFDPEAARQKLSVDPAIQHYGDVARAANSFYGALNSAVGQNNGVLGTAAIDAFLQSQGINPSRPGAGEALAKSLGLSEAAQTKMAQIFGSGGMSVGGMQKITSVINADVQASRQAALQRKQSDTAAGGPTYAATGVPGEDDLVPPAPSMPSFKAFGAAPAGGLTGQARFQAIQDARMLIARRPDLKASVSAAMLNDGIDPKELGR